jgi:hypothetical protein
MDGVLHVDHILAIANGGTNAADNLITACDRCNMGKAAVPLGERRFEVGDPKRAREHAAQLKRYMEAQQEVVAAKEAATTQLTEMWCRMLGVDTYHRNLKSMLPKATAEFGMERLCDFISIVADHRHAWAHKHDSWVIDCMYFCGVLRKRREKGWK